MTTSAHNSADYQILIEGFNSKNTIHTLAFVAIMFAAFLILIVLNGKIDSIQNPSVLYLIFIELVIFPFSAIYCLFQSIYYQMCAEKIKHQYNLVYTENRVKEEAMEAIPQIAKKINKLNEKLVKFDEKNLGLEGDYRRLFFVFLLVYILWFVTVFSVLWLPI